MIPSGTPVPKKPDEAVQWISAGSSVEIRGRRISCGLLYLGVGQLDREGYPSPSCLDSALRVGRAPAKNVSGCPLWPNYNRIHPDLRAGYLDWLAGDRRTGPVDIGYVFMYFYGIERFVLTTHRLHPGIISDWEAAKTELDGLLDAYGTSSKSLTKFLGGLLSYMSTKEGTGGPGWTGRESEDLNRLGLLLGRAAKRREAIGTDLAFDLYRLAGKGGPVTDEEAFRRKFTKEFASNWPGGFLVETRARSLKRLYSPASSDYPYGTMVEIVSDYPDVLADAAAVAPVFRLGESIRREMAKRAAARAFLSSRKAIVTRLVQEAGLVPFAVTGKELADRLCLPFSDLKDAAGRLRMWGLGVEPWPIKPGDVTVLYQIEPLSRVEQSPERRAAALLTSSGFFRTRKDAYAFFTAESLPDAEIAMVLPLLDVLPPSPSGNKALRAAGMVADANTRASLNRFVHAAVARAPTPEEALRAEKAGKALGLTPSEWRIPTAAATEKFDVVKAAFIFDESRKLAARLDEVFSGAEKDRFRGDPAVGESVEKAGIPEENPRMMAGDSPWGLDRSHASFALVLAAEPEWATAALEALSRSLGLPLEGALEILNEAAYEAIGEPFIEDGRVNPGAVAAFANP